MPSSSQIPEHRREPRPTHAPPRHIKAGAERPREPMCSHHASANCPQHGRTPRTCSPPLTARCTAPNNPASPSHTRSNHDARTTRPLRRLHSHRPPRCAPRHRVRRESGFTAFARTCVAAEERERGARAHRRAPAWRRAHGRARAVCRRECAGCRSAAQRRCGRSGSRRDLQKRDRCAANVFAAGGR